MKKLLLLLCISISSSAQRIYLAIIENNTYDGYFRYSGIEDLPTDDYLVTPLSIKEILSFTEVTQGGFALNAIKGDNPSIYMRQGGFASGSCGNNNAMPHYLELWTGDPSAFAQQKQYVRYCVTEQELDRGFFGLRIESDGTPKLFPVKGVSFLDDKFVVHDEPEKVESPEANVEIVSPLKIVLPTTMPSTAKVAAEEIVALKEPLLAVEEPINTMVEEQEHRLNDAIQEHMLEQEKDIVAPVIQMESTELPKELQEQLVLPTAAPHEPMK